MKKTLSACFQCGLLSALCLGGALPAHARLAEPDFTQLERLTELRPCKRMEKEFKPILSEIEKDRQKTGVGTQVLWVDLYNTGYCTALPVPMTELGKLSLERFPKEIPFGFRAVNWNTVQQDIDWSLPYKLDGISLWDSVWSLITLYYDKKNKRLYWMEYGIEYGVEDFRGFRAFVDNSQGGLDETSAKSLYEIHYQSLLDDFAATAQAGKRDFTLVGQILRMQQRLKEDYEDSAFLEAEHIKRAEVIKLLEKEVEAIRTGDASFNDGKLRRMRVAFSEIQAWKQAKEAERQAPYKNNTDFSRLERVSAQSKSCKRMEKEFRPAFLKIEEERRREGIEAPSQVLWVDNYDGTGYCMAVSYPLVDNIPLILKHFPKEFLVGGRFVIWDSVRRETVSDTVGATATRRIGSGPTAVRVDIENPNIESLRTAYYDRKNKTYHWMEYRLAGKLNVQSYMEFDDYEYLFEPNFVPFLELHYRTLLDDLAETARAGRHNSLLVLQILQLQTYLREQFNDAAFLDAERRRRGSLMRILDSARIEDLAEGGWTRPDVCTEGERWWPCHKAKEGD